MPLNRPLAGLRYLRPAAEDYRAQLAIYRAISTHLGDSFAECVQAAERLAQGNPGGFAAIDVHKGLRAIVIRRFPYRLIYAALADGVLVVAIAHTAMEPSQFFGRV